MLMKLLRSQAFWVAFVAMVHTIVATYLKVPVEIWVSIDSFLGVIIAILAVDSAAARIETMLLRMNKK